MESSEEPPAKRARLNTTPRPSSPSGGAQSRREALKARLRSQLLPHIVRAVYELPAKELRLDAIAVQAATILVKDPGFRSQLGGGETGLLTPDDGATTAQKAAEVQYRLTQQTEERPVAIKEEHPASHMVDAITSVPTPPPPPPQETRLRTRPVKLRLRGEPPAPSTSQWTRLTSRPYLPAHSRHAIERGTERALAKAKPLRGGPALYHVDFSAAEITRMLDLMAPYVQFPIPRTAAVLKQLCMEYPVPTLLEGKLRGRTEEDVRNFCSDLLAGKAADAKSARILSLHRGTAPRDDEHRREARVSSLLLARELEGHRGTGRTRSHVHFQAMFRQAHEDALAPVAEFTNCAGDLSAMTWVPGGNILCGTTAHSDSHNQQYNKPGNLLLCSTQRGVLRAFPDHRVPRPRVVAGENATEAMRRSQDPWVYSSVVSSDYDVRNGFGYTSSFDRTVKAWRIDEDGAGMEAVATFHHEGVVNFVAAAKDGSGLVATAADVTSDAIRIYTMDPHNMAESTYYTIPRARTDPEYDKWAYFPATMQWGIAPGTQHLLLVGYSPRPLTGGDEHDIPADKQHSGEILLWDAHRRQPVHVLTATTANVFEVAWHPTVRSFVVGTSPCGLHVDQGVRTQVHVFRQDMQQHPDGAYSEYQKLDCAAADINELAIAANSKQSAYITAACTDGRVYVWDMCQGDKPIHVLAHGAPLDGLMRPEDRERDDTGVKFTAWGSGLDRLYTGSSDGVVKVWNIRNKRKPFVRDLLRAPGPIACGSFSPDFDKLAIGDATGRLFLFSVTRMEKLEEQFTMVLPGTNRRIRRPKPFTPHDEPPPPPPPSPPKHDPDAMTEDDYPDAPSLDDQDLDAATYARRRFLDTQQVRLHPVAGAVQGPLYGESGLFRRELHLNADPAAPLLAHVEGMQQASQHSLLRHAAGHSARWLRRLPHATQVRDDTAFWRHRANVGVEFDAARLEPDTLDELVREGALLKISDEEDWGFEYEDD